MSVVNIRDSNFIKLKSIKKEHLKVFCGLHNIKFSMNMSETISAILDDFDNGKISTEDINSYIRKLYVEIRDSEMQNTGATHQEIIKELNKIDVTFEDGVVRVSASTSQSDEEKSKKRYFMSSMATSFNYSFRIPEGIVRDEEPTAELDNGVLKLAFKKAEKKEPKKITVSKKAKISA
jgi:hypothetical protein